MIVRLLIVVGLSLASLPVLAYFLFVTGYVGLVLILVAIFLAVRFIGGPSTTVFPTWLRRRRDTDVTQDESDGP
jgi:hypothetical protein